MITSMYHHLILIIIYYLSSPSSSFLQTFFPNAKVHLKAQGRGAHGLAPSPHPRALPLATRSLKTVRQNHRDHPAGRRLSDPVCAWRRPWRRRRRCIDAASPPCHNLSLVRKRHYGEFPQHLTFPPSGRRHRGGAARV